MSRRGTGDLSVQDFQKAVNDAALIKSEFYKEVKKEIREAIAREKPKLDKDGNPVFEGTDPVMVENLTDDMISAIFSIGMRGSKIGDVQDSYIRRIERGAYYSRILEEDTATRRIAGHLKERTRMDVAIVVKNILPDMTRIQTSVFPQHDPYQEFVDGAGGAGYPPRGAGFLTQEQYDKLLEMGKG